MANKSLASMALYYLCKPLISRGEICLDTPENYFQYEVEKSRNFDENFGLDPGGKVILEIGSNVGGYVGHALSREAKFVYGIEYDAGRYQSSLKLLSEKYNHKNYEIINADARNLSMINDNSVDVIVSDAVLEHIKNINKVFDEIYRILKPGGKAYLATSPIWFTYNGAHQWRYIPIPWVHILFPDKVILDLLEKYKETGEFPADRIDNMIHLYKTIGKLSLHKIRKYAKQSGLHIESLRNESRYELKKILAKIPVLDEIFAGDIRIVLYKA